MRGKDYWLARLESRVRALRNDDKRAIGELDRAAANDRHGLPPPRDGAATSPDYAAMGSLALVLRVLRMNDEGALEELGARPDFSRSALFHVNRKHLIETRINLNQTRFYGGLNGQEGEAVLGHGDLDEDDEGRGVVYV